jgi:hypothetical protein
MHASSTWSLNTFGSIASLVALVPLATAVAAVLVQRFGRRRLLRLQRSRGLVDVVTTTSDDSVSPRGPTVRRLTTGHGQVQGVAYCAQVVGRLYRKLVIRVSMSKQLVDRLENDLVILGGLRGNEVAEAFVEEVNIRRPGAIAFDDDPRAMTISIPGWSVPEYNLDIDADGYIQRDLALVVAWRNPFAGEPWRRGIMCVGFSSYGTAEAARWLFSTVIPSSPRAWFSTSEPSMRRLRRGMRRKELCLAVIEIRYRHTPLPTPLGVPIIRYVTSFDLPLAVASAGAASAA